jgi:hypothetical protein
MTSSDTRGPLAITYPQIIDPSISPHSENIYWQSNALPLKGKVLQKFLQLCLEVQWRRPRLWARVGSWLLLDSLGLHRGRRLSLWRHGGSRLLLDSLGLHGDRWAGLRECGSEL